MSLHIFLLRWKVSHVLVLQILIYHRSVCQWKRIGMVKRPTPDQKTYEKKNGNYVKGDGYLYRGRGYIQITGRANYRHLGKAIGQGSITWAGDPGNQEGYTNALELDPHGATDPETAAQIAVVGLRDGLFRPSQGTLRDNIDGTRAGFERARYMVNAAGLQKGHIAGRAIDYLNAMKGHCF